MTLSEKIAHYSELDLDLPVEELEKADDEISEILLFDRIGWYGTPEAGGGLRSYERRILEDVKDQIREKLQDILKANLN